MIIREIPIRNRSRIIPMNTEGIVQAKHASNCAHPMSRRSAISIGTLGLLGLGTNHLTELQASRSTPTSGKAKKVIFIFLSGGLSHHDTFDMKPNASSEIRGEFNPISTRTPGLQICEHLPQLARRSHLWSLCRSVTHSTNEHSQGHHILSLIHI